MKLSITLILSCFFTLNSIYPKNNLYYDIDLQTTQQIDICESQKNLIEFMGVFFQEQYAPFDWKKKYLNWDWTKHINHAKDLINTKKSTSDFHKILKKLIHSTKDPHVEILFNNGMQMHLPISVFVIDQRVMVYENTDSQSIIEPKDEILTINGESAINVYNKFLIEDFGSEINIPKSFKIKHPRFTHRRDSKADEMPSEHYWILEMKNKNQYIYKTMVFWKKELEKQEETESQDSLYIKKNTLLKLFKESKSKQAIYRFCKNDQKSFIPTIGKICLDFYCDENDGIYAYISLIDKKKIGFLRISNYSTLNINKLSEIITTMEQETLALVLDLTNNPGGYLESGMNSLSLLSNKPLLMPKFIIKIDHEIFKDANEKLYYLNSGNNTNQIQEILPEFIWENMNIKEKNKLLDSMKQFYKDIVEKWNNGIYTTEKQHYLGIEKIFPHKKGYSKPILMVINESSSSCTEFVAAALQDNKRAFSIGSETSGAGGFVKECFLTNIHGIKKWTTTSSVLFRLNGLPIEHLGVQPDIKYNISWEDVINDFSEMNKKIESVIYNILVFGIIHFGVK